MKLRLDAAARLEYACEEGFQMGFELGLKKGTIVGQIEILQLFLGLQQLAAEEHLSYEMSNLRGMSRGLRKKLHSR